MKDKIVGIVIWTFIILLFLGPFLAEYSYVIEDMQINPFDYARITDVNYKAVVVDEEGSRGKVVITERLVFDVHAASQDNLFWELWRDLPEDYIDGVKVSYKVNSVKQIMPDGSEIVYEQSPKLYWDDSDYVSTNTVYGPGKWYHSKGPYDEDAARYECVFFYVYGMYREKAVFEIEYEMYNAALRYNDCSDLYLPMYYGSTVEHLNSFTAQILFPEKDMPSFGNYKVFTYGTNANEFPVTESDSLNPGYHTFSISLNKNALKFRPYNQYIEFELVSFGEDRHIFAENASINEYTYDNVLDEIYDEYKTHASAPTTYRVAKIVVFVILLALTAYILFYSFTAGKRMRSKHTFYKPTTEINYFRDIPSDLDPNFATTLVFSKHKPLKDDSGVYSAILLSLARKKYIEIQEIDAKNTQIIIKKPVLRTPPPPPMNPWQMPNQFNGQPALWQAPNQFNGQPAPCQAPNQFNGQPAPWQAPNQFNGQPAPWQAPNQFSEQPPQESIVTENEEEFEPLTMCEQYYFNLLVRHAPKNVITMNILQSRVSADYNYTDSFVRNMTNSTVNIGIGQGYFQKADYTQPKKQVQGKSKLFMVLGILFITLVNITSYQTRMDLAFGAYFIAGIGFITGSIVLKKQSKNLVLLTQFGEDEYEKWRGLYNFLRSETLISDRSLIELPLWEKYLVYATAFGLSDKIIKAISIRCPEAGESHMLSNNYYRSGRIRHHSRSFRSSVRSGSSVARNGGYGGGGRGGGGGGGGH